MRPIVAQLAEGGTAVVYEASGYSEALDSIAAHPNLDLVLLDLRMPDVSGFAALADIAERRPDLPVVVMTGEEDAALVRAAFDHGALGFIPKSSAPRLILNACARPAGGTYVPSQIMASVPAAPAPPPQRLDDATTERLGITPRQADVLALLLAGKSNKLISRELTLAEGTVKNHVAAVLKALGVDTRVQAVIAASRLGLK
jgi:DNA-binding NarL/FixJ family response regulator